MHQDYIFVFKKWGTTVFNEYEIKRLDFSRQITAEQLRPPFPNSSVCDFFSTNAALRRRQFACSTMRSGSLRLLSALAAQLNLGMHRWDFVAAYLQGELLDGEVVYCELPPGIAEHGIPGHQTHDAQGRARVLLAGSFSQPNL